MRLLYVGLKYDYGVPQRGPSFEQMNFWHTLERMKGIEAKPFYFDEVMRNVGRREMNRLLLRAVEDYRPEVSLFVLFTDEIEKEVIRTISARTVTANWFSDDHWRFESFSRFWAPLFQWAITTDDEALEKYRAIGCHQTILSQWACNHFLYKPVDVERDIVVSFVGRAHSGRKSLVGRLRRAGIDIRCWGRGWKNGRLSHDEMIRLYSRSKINLNFTESSVVFSPKAVAKIFLKRRADATIRLNGLREMIGSARTIARRPRRQIKGRNFEIPGAGGFLLTETVDRLERYYIPGKEIAVFSGAEDLIEKVQYYLRHDDEREAVRRAGYERTLREHTFEQRFRTILETMGFKTTK